MPRYFFNLRNDIYVDDEEGVELPSIVAAQERATSYALDMAAVSVVEHHRIKLSHHIEIADDSGQALLKVKFGDVLTVEP